MLYFKAPGGELVPYTGVLTFYIKSHPGERRRRRCNRMRVVCGGSLRCAVGPRDIKA